MVEEEYHINDTETNNQKEYGNDTISYLVKDNDKTQHSETTEYAKKIKTIPEESEPQYHFQGQYVISQHWFGLDPDWIKDNLMTRSPDFQNPIL